MTGIMKVNKIGLMLVLVGVVGTVLFFPWKLENGRTCMAQRYIHGEGLQAEGNSMMEHGHSLARYYVFHYGLFWWVSMGLIITGFCLVRKKKPIEEDVRMSREMKRVEAAKMTE